MTFYLRDGAEFLVNTQTNLSQRSASITNLTDGAFVVSWTTFDSTQDGDQDAIKAQIFEADGTTRGTEFLVNTQATDQQVSSTLTGLPNGGFVAAWRDENPLSDGSFSAVKAQVFDADGGKLGAEFLVNTASSQYQFLPTITGLTNSDFVVSWTTNDGSQDGDGEAVKGQIFDSLGVKKGTEFLVNTQVADGQRSSTITDLVDGGFVVSWRTSDVTQDGDLQAIKAQVFNADGARRGVEFLVNSETGSTQHEPSVTGLTNGGFVVVWNTSDVTQDGDGQAIKAQIFDAAGVKQGAEFLVNTASAESQHSPKVASLPNGGFVATWQTLDPTQDGDDNAIKAQVFDAIGVKQGAEFLVNSDATADQRVPDVTGLEDGSFAITWTSEDITQDGSGFAIKAQIFEVMEGIPDLEVSQSSVNETQINNQAFAVLGVGGIGDSETYSYTIVTDPTEAFAIEGDKLIVTNNGNLDHEAATPVALTVRVTDSDGNTRDQDITLDVTDTVEELRYTANGEFLVNTEALGIQLNAAIAELEDGGFVITWDTQDPTQDGSSDAVKAQVFDAEGSKQGAEFLVNTQTLNVQGVTDVIGLANGDFVVTWATADTAQDGSESAIKAQVFESDGTKKGAELLVNTNAADIQGDPNITSLSNGGFVVTWQTFDITQDGDGLAVKGQVFDPIGNKVGTEFLANTATAENQLVPTITGLANGTFVIAWRNDDATQDGDGTSIKAQVFDASGGKLGAELLVNTQSDGGQNSPDITALSGGGFVAAWFTQDTAQDGSSSAIKAQVFDALGSPLGSEFLVNTDAIDSQRAPNVSDLPNGGFVVTWYTEDPTQDGSESAIKAQIFDANGAKQGDEFRVNIEAEGEQIDPKVISLKNGDLVITWPTGDPAQDGNGSAIKAQLFTLTTVPTANADTIDGTMADETIDLLAGDDVYMSGGGVDAVLGNMGNDMVHLSNIDTMSGEGVFAGTFDGGADTDDLRLDGAVGDYRIIQHLDTYKFYHQDHTDAHALGRLIATATNIEEFMGTDLEMLTVEDAFAVRATTAVGTAPTDMSAIRDFDGNNLGNNDDWKLIGQADVQYDGDAEFIYINQTNGRWATVGPDSSGNVVFSDFGMGGETRVVGIYIDPEVEADPSKQGGPFDSQQRFQNDLNIDNLTVIDAFDFDDDGFQEIYFKVNDGTAYLRALMHADGNIQYANYQSAEQVETYLTDLGYGQDVLDTILV